MPEYLLPLSVLHAAGWKVTITHDQRDGSFMTFMMENP